jgi:hypothetical protein
MGQLGLSRSELSESFCNGHRFHATSKEGVEFLTASRDLQNFLTHFAEFCAFHEAKAFNFSGCLLNLFHLGLVEP